MLKRLKKKLLDAPWFEEAVCWLVSLYVRAVRATVRVEEVGAPPPAPFVGAIWHGRIMLPPAIWRRRMPMSFLISSHRDGRFIAKTVAHLGVDWIEGSTTRGGVSAFRELLRELKRGRSVGITPDGPRGPRMRVQGGVIDVARRAGAPIVPASFSSRRGRNLDTWDRFLLTHPFTRAVLLWGEPIHVPADADEDERRRCARELEDALNALTAEADRRCGREVVEPAPLEEERAATG